MRRKLRYITVAVIAVLGLSVVQSAAPANASPRSASGRAASAHSARVVHRANAMTRAQYAALNRSLAHNRHLSRVVAVRRGVKTITYTDSHGFALQLRFRTAASERHPNLSVGGCGFLQVCVF